jgi:hypothetical protein
VTPDCKFGQNAKIFRPTHARRIGERGQHVALRYILDAWEEAVYDGLDPDCIATAAIFRRPLGR